MLKIQIQTRWSNDEFVNYVNHCTAQKIANHRHKFKIFCYGMFYTNSIPYHEQKLFAEVEVLLSKNNKVTRLYKKRKQQYLDGIKKIWGLHYLVLVTRNLTIEGYTNHDNQYSLDVVYSCPSHRKHLETMYTNILKKVSVGYFKQIKNNEALRLIKERNFFGFLFYCYKNEWNADKDLQKLLK